MSGIASKIVNSFKHPDEPTEEKGGAESSSAKQLYDRESQAGPGQTRQSQAVNTPHSTTIGNTAENTHHLHQGQTSTTRGQDSIGHENQVPHISETLDQDIPRTGYVGSGGSAVHVQGQSTMDHGSSEQFGHGGAAHQNQGVPASESGASRIGTAAVGSASHSHGHTGSNTHSGTSRAGDDLPGGSTGREGVPGTTVSGDPSMGGKSTRAQT